MMARREILLNGTALRLLDGRLCVVAVVVVNVNVINGWCLLCFRRAGVWFGLSGDGLGCAASFF